MTALEHFSPSRLPATSDRLGSEPPVPGGEAGEVRFRRNLADHQTVDEGRVAALLRTSIIAACKAYALGKSKLGGSEGRHRITHLWVRLLEA